MIVSILTWVVIILSLLNSGFMLFDGMRAFIIGDYLRPKTGEYAGLLGPWSKVVSYIGINPLSAFMKIIFIVFGLFGLCITYSFILEYPRSWQALLIYNICALWYFVTGTIISILQISLLLIIKYLF
jgi:hypothetical protein